MKKLTPNPNYTGKLVYRCDSVKVGAATVGSLYVAVEKPSDLWSSLTAKLQEVYGMSVNHGPVSKFSDRLVVIGVPIFVGMEVVSDVQS